MLILAERLKALRVGMKMSQKKTAELAGTTQASIARYEKQMLMPPHTLLLWYADYFDVSMDYIYGRTDQPHGKHYEFRPRLMEDSPEMRQFIEMCFDPDSPMHDKLKKTLIDMIEGVKG